MTNSARTRFRTFRPKFNPYIFRTVTRVSKIIVSVPFSVLFQTSIRIPSLHHPYFWYGISTEYGIPLSTSGYGIITPNIKKITLSALKVCQVSRNRWFHVFVVQKLKTKVVFIETRGIRLRLRPSAATSIETPGFNETTLVSIFEPPKTWNHRFLVKVSLKPWFKKKKVRFPFKTLETFCWVSLKPSKVSKGNLTFFFKSWFQWNFDKKSVVSRF